MLDFTELIWYEDVLRAVTANGLQMKRSATPLTDKLPYEDNNFLLNEQLATKKFIVAGAYLLVSSLPHTYHTLHFKSFLNFSQSQRIMFRMAVSWKPFPF